jgi:hypothetical protein
MADIRPCGFKSHLPHQKKTREGLPEGGSCLIFGPRRVPLRESGRGFASRRRGCGLRDRLSMTRPGSPRNVLLVNPWIYDFAAYDFWLRPLGLLSAASILRECADVRLHWIDCLDRFYPQLGLLPGSRADGRGHYRKEEVAKPDILKPVPRKYSRYGIPLRLFEEELERVPVPDLVLIGCSMTYWYPGVQLAVEILRKKFGSVPIVLGGIYATLAETHAVRQSGADRVISGPAEDAIPPLAREIWGAVSGREPGLNHTPWPAIDLLRDKTSLPLLTSRGCPLDCAFCAAPRLHPRIEQRPPDDVVEEIADRVEKFGTRHFAFYDDALLFRSASHLVPILEGVVRRFPDVSFHAPNGLGVREIDRDVAQLFRRANVRSLYLSQESIDETVLRDSSSKVASGDLEAALNHLEAAGYDRGEISVYLLAGLPGQSVRGIAEGIWYVRRLGARPRLANFSPVPGTRVWQDLVDRGRLKADADPLVSNKMVFPYLWGDMSPGDYAFIHSLLRVAN